jgi:hypothetical protein|tara:strand:+ start:249 stop:749 length:501 start_codon:yes stop_codon:yes gene_type:complete
MTHLFSNLESVNNHLTENGFPCLEQYTQQHLCEDKAIRDGHGKMLTGENLRHLAFVEPVDIDGVRMFSVKIDRHEPRSVEYMSRIGDVTSALNDRGFQIIAMQNAPAESGFWMVVRHGNKSGLLTEPQIDEVADIIDNFGFDVDDTYESRRYRNHTTLQCPCNLNP